MPRTILIVDDIRSNREILKNILGESYDILEAGHGREAIAVMNRDYKRISAMLLDLSMPVMDGFEVLSIMQKSATLCQIPVIIMTGQTDSDSEERALKLGAKDYISKPYKSAIIRQRIANTINLRETAATVNAMRVDRLTGLLGREAFFDAVSEAVKKSAPGSYIMASFDIDSFKVINDQYGTEKGDEVLRYIAKVFQSSFEPHGGVCCRVAADNFAVLYPASFINTPELAEIRREATNVSGLVAPISFSVGRYLVNDLSLSPSAMYDRATLAESTVKGRFDRNTAFYDESMRDYLLSEQRIVNEMSGALENRQFEAWFQPQYNHSTGALVGAEALARWRHPVQGLIPPNAFIPIFEKNGFIYKLDKYIWEETCRYLRKWIDENRSPLPVSVNISRYDIFRPDLVDTLTGLVKAYGIPVDLLRLEITESAFTESTEQIVAIIKRLIDCGFTLEIDDFGSGYSSLNTLKSVPAQILKLDMRFLDDDGDTGRGGSILESIVRMAKWLGMSIIAEGVEEKVQADFLNSIGCSYVQGYLYARPMPAEAYEAHCKDAGKEERLLTIETVENLDSFSFWDPKSMDTLIFNSYVGAACIYEYHQGRIELLRATEKYAQVIGGAGMSIEDALRLDWSEHLDAESGARIIEDLDRSVESKTEVTGEYIFLDLPGCPHETFLRSTMRVIASAGKRYLVYCTNENITLQRIAERSERRVAKQLQSILDNVSCGITAVQLNGLNAEFLLANNLYFSILGYTRAQFQKEIGHDIYATVHPEDRERITRVVERVQRTGTPARMEYRAMRRDNSTVWLRSNLSITRFEDVAGDVQLATYTDVTSEKLAAQELLDNLPGGAALYEYDGSSIVPLHLNKRYWALVDRAPLDYQELSVLGAVHPDDRSVIYEDLAAAISENRDVACDIRVRYGADGYRPFHIVGRIVPKSDGKYAIYASYTPISDDALSIREMLPIALRTMMETQSGFSFVKDKNLRYVCCSRAIYEAAGFDSDAGVVGKTNDALMESTLAATFNEADRHVLETGEPLIDGMGRLPTTDGSIRYSLTSRYPLKDSRGDIVGVYGVGRDVTEALETRSQLEILNNNLPGGIAIYEGRPDALDRIRLTYFSDGFCRLFQYTRKEYEERALENPMGQVFPEYVPQLFAAIQALIHHNTPMDCVYRAHVNGGGYKWINLKAQLGEPHGDDMTVNAVLFDVTARQEALEKLRVSEEENRLAIRHSQNVVCRYDVATRQLTVSPLANPIFDAGSVIEDVPYSSVKNGKVSRETSDAYIAFFERIMRGEKNGELIYQRTSSKGWRWLEAHFSTIFSEDGKPVSAVISFADVTDRFEKEAVYKKWQQSIQDKDPASYSLFRCGVSKKTAFDTIEGSLLSIDAARGPFLFDDRTAEYVQKCVFPEDSESFLAFLNIGSLLSNYYQGRRIMSFEYREKLENEGFRWIRLTVDLVESSHSRDIEAYLLFENIDAAKRAALLTIQRAETDPLTGVLNRAVFTDRVNRAIRSAKPYMQHALLMLDVDGFKQVNDAFGHSTGDHALMEIAVSLRSALRREDLIGRIGGDEFSVFLSDIPSDAVAANKAQQICALMRKSFSMEVEISGSVGISVSPRDGMDFDTLYKKADSALYYVKGSGKDNYAFYHDDMADQHLELEKVGSDPSAEKKRRMLIVDDNRIDYAVLANLFEKDFLVEKASDGNAALIRLRHFGSAVSIVLLDLVMPGLDGFGVLKRMQESPEMRSIPVVVVSGDDNIETGLRAIRAGASDFVTKPVDPELLRVRVQSAVSKAENERLRAMNSLLEYQNSIVARYRTVLERSGVSVIEHDWVAGTFLYDPGITAHLAGTYDSRKLWQILLSDFVADTKTVKALQELVHNVAEDRARTEGDALVQLKTPKNVRHWFRVRVFKTLNDFGLTGKLYLAFADMGYEKPAE